MGQPGPPTSQPDLDRLSRFHLDVRFHGSLRAAEIGRARSPSATCFNRNREGVGLDPRNEYAVDIERDVRSIARFLAILNSQALTSPSEVAGIVVLLTLTNTSWVRSRAASVSPTARQKYLNRRRWWAAKSAAVSSAMPYYY
jgi:hypothetical protein